MSLAGGAARRTQGSPGGPVEHLEGSGRGRGVAAAPVYGAAPPCRGRAWSACDCARWPQWLGAVLAARGWEQGNTCGRRVPSGKEGRGPNSVCGAWWASPLPPNLPLSPRSRHLQTS